jgi:hypothetical protein
MISNSTQTEKSQSTNQQNQPLLPELTEAEANLISGGSLRFGRPLR